MALTIEKCASIRGKAVYDYAVSLGGTLVADTKELVLLTYGYAADVDESTLSVNELELLGAVMISKLLDTFSTQQATEGIVQRIVTGDQANADITFFDGLNVLNRIQTKLVDDLEHLHRAAGFVPYMSKDMADVPFVGKKVETFPDDEEEEEDEE